MNAINISNLSFTYKSWVSKKSSPVFSNFDFSIKEGEHLLILANPEGGKTTFSRIINNLIPKFIDGKLSGDIFINEKNLCECEPYELIKDICYVSQNPLEMFVSTTCENEVAFPLESLGLEQCEMQKRVKDSLSKWGLLNYSKASPFELSGGERKRLLLAVSNAIDPSIYILDEAFDDLDKSWRDKLSKDIKESKKTVVVLSARYLSQFNNCFDSIKVFDRGQIRDIDCNDAINQFTHKSLNTYLKNSILLDNYKDRVEKSVIKNKSLNVSNLVSIRRRTSVKDESPFVLKSNDFSVKSSQVVRLIGSNGSGKSTFSRILCGLDEFKSGDIYLNNKIASSLKLQKNVGYLFQNPDFQIFLPTVYEELSWGLFNDGRYSTKEINEKVEKCAKLFSLDLKDTPTTMSFALRKKLQAAVYYLLERPFLILDELDGAMSYEDAYFIINELSKMGTALIIITHDDNFAKEISNKTYLVDKGVMEELHEC